MTRINCIPPAELSDKHLLAEYRELPRVFKLAAAAYERGDESSGLYSEYLLGKGHVTFFYRRLLWCRWRMQDLVAEMRTRGWNPAYQDAPSVANHLPLDWWGQWTPTPAAMALNRERIRLRTRIPTVR